MTGELTTSPATLVIDAQPGQAAAGSITLSSPPADRAVAASLAADANGFSVSAISVTVKVWHRYTEQEIDELPEALRAAARKAGGYWEPQTTSSDGTTPVEVPAGAEVTISVSATLPSVGVTGTTLTLTGTVWGTVVVPVFAVVGTATATPVASVNSLGLMCLPGDTAKPTVTIQAPPPATVLATLSDNSTGIEITQVTVRIPVRREWTPDELLDLPEQLREQAKKTGWIDWQNGPQGGPGVPLVVPPNSVVQVSLSVAVPDTDAPDYLTGTLTLLSTTWYTAEIPINVVVSDFDSVALTDRVSVQQGVPSAPIQVSVSSSLGPDTDVHFSIADADAADVAVDVAGTHVARHSTLTQDLRVTVAPNAVLGNYPIYLGSSNDVGLRVTAFGGIYNRQFPLGLTLLPGVVTVAALQPVISGVQGGTATCQLSVNVSGGNKQLTVTAGALPDGVTMASVDEFLTGPITTTITLQFTIDIDASTEPGVVSLQWSAGDDSNAGALSLPFAVQLLPQSQTFSQQIVTPDGTALGGHLSVSLDNSGNSTFSGAMRATGAPSYAFQVRAVIRSADGFVAFAYQKSGEVCGTLDPFKEPREEDWNEPASSKLLTSQWPEIRTAAMAVSHGYELAGVLGTIEDLVVDWVKFLIGAALMTATGGVAAVIFVGAELAGITGGASLGPGGLPGVIITAGAVALLGPGIMIPVLVASTIVGDLTVQHRRLSDPEIAMARLVFGDLFPFDRVWITNLKGLGGTEFTVPGTGEDILVNFGDGFGDAIAHVAPDRGYYLPGQLMIHELTHAWQIAFGDDDLDYYSRVVVAKLAGKSAYRYGGPGPVWSSFGLEQQATIIEEWAMGIVHRATVTIAGRVPAPVAPPPAPQPQGMSLTDAYYRYVAANILPGVT